METDRLQHERARSAAKRQVAEKEPGDDDDDDDESEEVLTPVIGAKDVETTKMLTLDLIKAVDQAFSDLHAALRPDETILPAEWSSGGGVRHRLSCTPAVSGKTTDVFVAKPTSGRGRRV